MKALVSWIQKFKNMGKVDTSSTKEMDPHSFFQQIISRRKHFLYWTLLHIFASSFLWLILFNILFPNLNFYTIFAITLIIFTLQIYHYYIQVSARFPKWNLNSESIPHYFDLLQTNTNLVNDNNKENLNLIQSIEKIHRKRILFMKLQFLILSIAILATTLIFRPELFNLALSIHPTNRDFVKLRILNGASKELNHDSSKQEFTLTPLNPLKLNLNSENVIEITLKSSSNLLSFGKLPPILRLEYLENNSDDKVTDLLFESEVENETTKQASIQLNLDRSVNLKIPSLWQEQILATIHIEKVYPPDVQAKILNLPINPDEVIDDTQNLIFQIQVQSNTPLQEVALHIVSSEKKYREIVHKIESTESKTIQTDYSLNLAPYMDQDSEQFEIVVEAIDRSSPVPLKGESDRFIVKALTAYGKHQQALSSLKELHGTIKNLLGEEKNNPLSWKELETKEKEAYLKSEQSPYFDFNDRMRIDQFAEQISLAIAKEDKLLLLDTESNLSYFLLEHEAIHQTERDRDFFSAIRNFSRLLDQSHTEKDKDKIYANQKKLDEFLAERHQTWVYRVKQLSENKIPKQWKDIQSEKYFSQKIQSVVTNFFSDQKNLSQAKLSKLSEEYKLWIEALEEAEQKSAQESLQNSKANLNQALNQIKELQKRQNGIVNSLDTQTALKTSSANKIQDSWPSIRAESASIANATKELEAQMRAIFPQASKRIKFAEDSMQKSIESGNKGEFSEAESFADMAGRLLRLASSEAQKQSEDRKNRSRRTRLNSDQNYGKGTVLGGDIEISQKYTVDPKYREHIMDDVKSSILESPENLKDSDRRELDYYLQKTLR